MPRHPTLHNGEQRMKHIEQCVSKHIAYNKEDALAFKLKGYVRGHQFKDDYKNYPQDWWEINYSELVKVSGSTILQAGTPKGIGEENEE